MDELLHLRVLSAIVGIPAIILAAWYGNWLLWLLTLVVFLVASLEMTEILRGLSLKPSLWIVLIGGLITFSSAYLYNDEYLGLTIVFIVILNLLLMAFLYPKITPLNVFGHIFATLYLCNLLYIFLTRGLDNGFIWVLLLFTATWASDTFAYFAGRLFGRNKLAPLLSPKKTIEGAVGGVLGSMATAGIFAQYIQNIALIHLVVLGLGIGVASLLGDLVESALKRQSNIKDSGQIIPGHGGVLDRFDSLLFTSPLVYYYVKLFII